jgi:hypothetical protein
MAVPHPNDPVAAAMTSLAGQLAAALGMVRSVPDLVAKLTDNTDQFNRTIQRLSPGAGGGGPPRPSQTAATVRGLSDAGKKELEGLEYDEFASKNMQGHAFPTSAKSRLADLRLQLGRASVVNPLPMPVQGTPADAAEAAFNERKQAFGGGPIGDMASSLRDIREASRAILDVLRTHPPGGGGGGQGREPAGKKPHWLFDTIDRVKTGVGKAVNRGGKWFFGKRGWKAVSGFGKRMGGAVRAGAAATAGRGAVGGLFAGARAGAVAGGAGGPAGMIAGLVAGTVAAAGKSLFDAGVSVFQTLAGSITRYLNPVALAVQAIAAPTSGHSTFTKAVGLLGATIGVVLMPLFLNLAAVVVYVAGLLRGPLVEASRRFGESALPAAIEAMALLSTAVEYTADIVRNLGAAFDALANSPLFGLVIGATGANNPALKAAAAGGAVSGAAGSIIPDLLAGGDSFDERLRKKRRSFGLDGGPDYRASVRGADGQERDAGGGDDSARRALKLTMEEFRRSLGGQSQAMSLGDVARNAQQSALNFSPFEAEMLKLVGEQIESAHRQESLLDGLTAKVQPPVR